MSDRLYDVGLASIDIGVDATLVIGNGTLWASNVVVGDTFEQGGIKVTILEVTDDTHLVLAYDWPGATVADVAYVIRQDALSRSSTANLSNVVSTLVDKLRIFDDAVPVFHIKEYGVNSMPGGAAVGDKYVVGDTPTGSFVGHEGEIATKTDTGTLFNSPEFGWIIISEVDGSGVNTVRNWDGDEWSATGSISGAPSYQGDWSSLTTYKVGNVVSRLSILYIAKADNTNSTPESHASNWAPLLNVGMHGGAFTLQYVFKSSTTASVADTAAQINADAALSGTPTILRVNKVDAFGTDWSAKLASVGTASDSALKGKFRLVVIDDTSKEFTADVSAVALDGGGLHYEFTLSNPLPVGTIADASNVLLIFTPKGDKGTIGDDGPQGDPGVPESIPLIFKTATADSDPSADGNGCCRLDTAIQQNAVTLRIDLKNSLGVDITDELDLLGQFAGDTIAVGALRKATDAFGTYLTFTVSSFTSPTGYRNWTIDIVGASSPNPFADGDAVVLTFIPLVKGDAGDTGTTGADGEPFTPQYVVATLAGRAAYDAGPEVTGNRRLSVLVEQDDNYAGKSALYFLLTASVISPAAAAVWSQGIPFAISSDAINIDYDNSTSLAASTTVKAALDELFAAGTQNPTLDVASAATTDLSAVDGAFARVTGAVGISAITMRPNQRIYVRWAAAGAITDNGTTLNLKGALSRTNEVDSWSELRADASSVVREINYSGGSVRTDAPQALSSTASQQARDNIGVAPAPNLVDNPALNIWQRGTSFPIASTTKTAVADRWKFYRGAAGATVSRQPGFNGSKYCIRIARDSGNSSTVALRFWQQLHESVARGIAGRTVVESFDVRCGADYSGGALSVRIHTGTAGSEAADLSQVSSAAFATGGAVTSVSSTVTPTTAAQRVKCAALVLGSSIADLAFQIAWTPSGTAGAADYIEITNVKFAASAVDTPFVAPNEAADLLACLFTYKSLKGGIPVGSNGTTAITVYARLETPMRVALTSPMISLITTTPGIIGCGAGSVSATGAAIAGTSAASEFGAEIQISGFTGLTTNVAGILTTHNAIKFDAELL